MLTRVEKLEPALVAGAVLAGFALARAPGAPAVAAPLVLPLLVLMLTGVFLVTPLGDARAVFKTPRAPTASLVVNFAWTPALALVLGVLFLREHPALWLGLVLLLVAPCTDWYLVFTQMARGNRGLAMGMLPWHLGLQVLLVPVLVFTVGGALTPLDAARVLRGAVLVLGIPVLGGVGARWVLARSRGTAWVNEALAAPVARAQLAFLALAVTAMFTAHADTITSDGRAVLALLPPLLAFYAVNLVLARVLARTLRLPRADGVSLAFMVLARNSPLALAFAVAAFPDAPLVALVLVAGALVELPVLAAVAWGLRGTGTRA